MTDFSYLDELLKTIASREGGDPNVSYVAKLLKKGVKRIAKKVGEEAVEVAIAAVVQPKEKVVSESADLLFHLMMLWHVLGIAPAQVMEELKHREGRSGIAEKKSRTQA
jgi:phosphoribosyl-ATP pyrophosphohydrolase